MKKLAFVFVVLGSGLTAFGFSGWHLDTLWFGSDIWKISAGWDITSQLVIVAGIMLLACFMHERCRDGLLGTTLRRWC
jgi:hypothetical protein